MNFMQKIDPAFDWLRSVFMTGTPSSPPKNHAADMDDLSDIERIEKHLDYLVSARGPDAIQSIANFQILDLDTIRDAVGPQWPHVRRLIHLLVENTLSKHLGSRDIFFQCTEDRYMVILDDAESEEANKLCANIMRDISRHLFGTGVLGQEFADGACEAPEMRAHVASIRLGDTFGEDGNVSFQQFSSMVDKTAPEIDGKSRDQLDGVLAQAETYLKRLGEDASNWTPILMEKRLSNFLDQLKALEDTLRPLAQSFHAGGTPRIGTYPRTPKDSPDIKWEAIEFRIHDPWRRLSSLIHEAEERLREIREEDKEPSSMDFGSADLDDMDLAWLKVPGHDLTYKLSYLPVFNANASAISMHHAVVVFKWGQESARLDEIVTEDDDPGIQAIATRLLIRRSLEEIEMNEDLSAPIVISVDEKTLDLLHYRRTFVEVASNTSERQRSYIIYELCIPESWGPLQIKNMVQQVRGYCRAIVLRSVIGAENQQVFAALGMMEKNTVAAVSVDVEATGAHDKAFVKDIKRFAYLCERFSLPSYVFGAKCYVTLLNAIGAGVTYISGREILHPVPEPSPPRSLSLVDLYRPLSLESYYKND